MNASPGPGTPDVDIPAGVWQHWKGHLYQVLGYASDASIDGRTVVVYVGLELDGARPGPRMHVREWAEFLECVPTDDVGTVVPRFSYVGPEWRPGAPVAAVPGRGAADGDTP